LGEARTDDPIELERDGLVVGLVVDLTIGGGYVGRRRRITQIVGDGIELVATVADRDGLAAAEAGILHAEVPTSAVIGAERVAKGLAGAGGVTGLDVLGGM